MRTGYNQWVSGDITVSSTPYVIELPINVLKDYRFPAVQVLVKIPDEVNERWRVCNPAIDYKLEFFDGKTMRVELNYSGSYRVNW